MFYRNSPQMENQEDENQDYENLSTVPESEQTLVVNQNINLEPNNQIPTAQPATQPAAQPASQPAAQPASQPAAQPAAQSSSQPLQQGNRRSVKYLTTSIKSQGYLFKRQSFKIFFFQN